MRTKRKSQVSMMQQIVRDIDEGRVERDPELEEQNDKESCAMLTDIRDRILVPYYLGHSERRAEVAAVALLRAAAFHCMTTIGMTPDDFADFSRCIAEASIPEVDACIEHLSASPN